MSQELLYDYAKQASVLLGGFKQIEPDLQQESIIDLMVLEALNTSDIEGESFDPLDLRSSIEQEFGFKISASIKDAHALGISKLMVNVRNILPSPLSKEMLFH
ncbi:MAG: DUF4172 domain-containing protein [Oligoflexales bacterium]|nr:DUF4172 domain-containing protein [Oligoflexales bacterium]